MRKVFLEDLPRYDKDKSKIKWMASIGYIVKGTYDELEFEVEIIDYQNNILIIKFSNNNYRISPSNFKKCYLGKILGKRTNEFKVEIGTRYKDINRDLTVISKRYIEKEYQYWKYYQYKCNTCGYVGEMLESALLTKGTKCLCCSNKIIVEGINDIPTTAPWMVKYFQGGYDEAKLYTKQSNKKIFPICPDCHQIKDRQIKISNLYHNNSIGCNCRDGKSYPEKIVYSMLSQLEYDFQTEKVFDWSKNIEHIDIKLCGDKKYDFYIPSLNCIIETHGLQHYSRTYLGNKKRTLKQEQENDNLKLQLAKDNGINYYIIIDCRKSELEFIKNNILNSELHGLINLEDVNWDKCEEFALSNLVKSVCNIKKFNNKISTSEIAEIVGLNSHTINRYLKRGDLVGWCCYNVHIEKASNKGLMKCHKLKCVKVVCLNNRCIFDSITNANLYCGLKNDSNNITSCCKGKRNNAGKHPETGEPLRWMYYDDYIKLHNQDQLHINPAS